MERLSYFVNNPKITPEIFYQPLIRQFLMAWEGMEVLLTLDTSLFWDEYCLIEVCFVWGGRSFPLAQKVMEHGSATVAYEDYQPLLEMTQSVLPPNCQVSLLADRGFEHGELIRWLRAHQWCWAIRAKSDLNITRSDGIYLESFRANSPQRLIFPKREVLRFWGSLSHGMTESIVDEKR